MITLEDKYASTQNLLVSFLASILYGQYSPDRKEDRLQE